MQDSKLSNIQSNLRAKYSKVPTKIKSITIRIILLTILCFRKDYTTIFGKLLPINPFLEDSFIKIRTDIVYSEDVRAFTDTIPEVGRQKSEDFVDTWLIRCKKPFSDTITKNNFVTPAKSTAKANPKKTTLKESDFNKLRVAASFCPSLCAEVFGL